MGRKRRFDPWAVNWCAELAHVGALILCALVLFPLIVWWVFSPLVEVFR